MGKCSMPKKGGNETKLMNSCLFIGRKNKVVFVYKALFSAFLLWQLMIMDIYIEAAVKETGITSFACTGHVQLSGECVWFQLEQCEPACLRQNYSTSLPHFPTAHSYQSDHAKVLSWVVLVQATWCWPDPASFCWGEKVFPKAPQYWHPLTNFANPILTTDSDFTSHSSITSWSRLLIQPHGRHPGMNAKILPEAFYFTTFS